MYTQEQAKHIVRLLFDDHFCYSKEINNYKEAIDLVNVNKKIYSDHRIKPFNVELIKLNKESFDKDLIIRPKYTVLRNSYLIKNKLNVMPRWEDSYNNYIKDQYLKKTNL